MGNYVNFPKKYKTFYVFWYLIAAIYVTDRSPQNMTHTLANFFPILERFIVNDL